MSTEDSTLLQLKGTHLIHGLEQLARYGIGPDFWHRLRLDTRFAEQAIQLMLDEDKRNPGISRTITLDRECGRLELQVMAGKRVWHLRSDIILALGPAPEKRMTPGEYQYYVVDPKRSVSEHEIRREVARRGLVPADTEDGLLFMAACTSTVSDSSIIVLDSYLETDQDRSFLDLSCTLEGRPGTSLWVHARRDKFMGGMRFLAKRPVVPNEQEPEA